MPRKKEGFRQLAGVEHIDKDAEHMFADLTRDQKREHQSGVAKEIRVTTAQVVSRDCLFHVQACIG